MSPSDASWWLLPSRCPTYDSRRKLRYERGGCEGERREEEEDDEEKDCN